MLHKPKTVSLRALIALPVALALALAALVATPISAHAAIGQNYGWNNTTNGQNLAFTDGTSTVARLIGLYGIGGASGFTGYSVDRSVVYATANSRFREYDWNDEIAGLPADARGPVEWIIKNSHPARTLVQLRSDIPSSYGFPSSGFINVDQLLSGTQAAIWYYTNGAELTPTTGTPASRALANYLIDHAEGQLPTSPTAPALNLGSEDDRTDFVIAPGTQFGPFTLEATTPVTLSLSGDPAQVVDIDGTVLAGPQPPGTSFWIQPTGTPALDGEVTVNATGQSVSGQVVNVALGTSGGTYNPANHDRAPLARLAPVSFPAATDSLVVSWEIDNRSPDDFNPDSGATERDFRWRPPVEQSPLLQRIWWTDGTSTVTDLIRFQGEDGAGSPNAYSADFSGPVPAYNQLYSEADWAEGRHTGAHGVEGEVLWILQNSYPQLSEAQFTQRLTAAGYNLHGAHIKNWNAIAATQAAIWHFTDGKDLDTRPYADPDSATASSTGSGSASNVLNSDSSAGWEAENSGPAHIDFVFREPLEVRGYTVTTLEGGAQANTPLGWELQRSSNGVDYTYVSTSRVSDNAERFSGGSAESQRSGNIPPGATTPGYRYYRLVFTGATDPTAAVEISQVAFEGFGNGRDLFPNDPQVVYAYEFLIAGAAEYGPGLIPADPSVSLTNPAADAGPSYLNHLGVFERPNDAALVGPFTFDGTTSARLTLPGAPDGRLLSTDDGTPVTELVVGPGDTFWIYPGDAEAGSFTIDAYGSAVNRTAARALNHATQPAAFHTFAAIGIASTNATAELTVTFTSEPEAEIELSVSEATIGDQVLVTGEGFRAGEEVQLTLHSDPFILGQTTALGDGTISALVTIAEGVTAGSHHIHALGLDSLRLSIAPLQIFLTETQDTGGSGESTRSVGNTASPIATQAPAANQDALPVVGVTNTTRWTLIFGMLLVAIGAGLITVRRAEITR